MAEALGMADFDGFDRGDFQPVSLTTLTLYDSKYQVPVMFEPERPKTNIAESGQSGRAEASFIVRKRKNMPTSPSS
ncbi:MAG: hypothetical protein R3E95_07520 [Thiolinea sp.]